MILRLFGLPLLSQGDFPMRGRNEFSFLCCSVRCKECDSRTPDSIPFKIRWTSVLKGVVNMHLSCDDARLPSSNFLWHGILSSFSPRIETLQSTIVESLGTGHRLAPLSPTMTEPSTRASHCWAYRGVTVPNENTVGIARGGDGWLKMFRVGVLAVACVLLDMESWWKILLDQDSSYRFSLPWQRRLGKNPGV